MIYFRFFILLFITFINCTFFKVSANNEIIGDYNIIYLENDKYIMYKDNILFNPIIIGVEDYNKLLSKIYDYNDYYRIYIKDSIKKINNISYLPSKNSLNFKIGKKYNTYLPVEFIPTGNLSLNLIGEFQNYKLNNTNINRSFNFSIIPNMNFSILTKIYNSLDLNFKYSNSIGFSFEDNFKLLFNKLLDNKISNLTSNDNILQNIHIGNLVLPFNIKILGGFNDIFGLRSDFKFGNFELSTLISNTKNKKVINLKSGDIINNYKLLAENYDYNKHFFLAPFFVKNYDKSLENYPVINTSIKIKKIEVWKLSKLHELKQNRSIRSSILLRDIGDGLGGPKNSNNSIFKDFSNINVSNINEFRYYVNKYKDNFREGEDYILVDNLRMLDKSEYDINEDLGYISLNTALEDGYDVLGVAFEYIDIHNPHQIHKVGQMSQDNVSKPLILKLIKSNHSVNVNSPLWELMMKNIYNISMHGFIKDDFDLKIYYKGINGKTDFIKGNNILSILNLDRVSYNKQNNQSNMGDGIFRFIPNITVNPNRGDIIFTNSKPFYTKINNVLGNNKYSYKELYSNIPSELINNKLYSKYSIEGSFKSNNSFIYLGTQGLKKDDIKVIFNGNELIENIDYSIDYELGRMTILNDKIKSSKNLIQVIIKDKSTYNYANNLFGVSINNNFNKKFSLGGSIINFNKKNIGNKNIIQNEPKDNLILTAHSVYNNDNLENLNLFINKTLKTNLRNNSRFNIRNEIAYIYPNKFNNSNNIIYIDDFNNKDKYISLLNPDSWNLASTPLSPAGYNKKYHPLFPYTLNLDDLSFNTGRKMISWYSIDNLLYENKIIDKKNILSDKSRKIKKIELFNNATSEEYLKTFDVTFYPRYEGPYTIESKDSNLSWAAIFREIPNNQENIDFIEFWLMDPTEGDDKLSGEILLHIGDISEDIMRDNRLSFEGYNFNTSKLYENNWGYQPSDSPSFYSFNINDDIRKKQDLGLDLMEDNNELKKYNIYRYNKVSNDLDPANDNFIHYLDNRFNFTDIGRTIQGRYLYFRNPQGNSSDKLYSKITPDSEDINKDFILNTSENYAQYTIKISKNYLEDKNNKIVVERKVINRIGGNNTKWYKLRIPIHNYDLDIDKDGFKELNNKKSRSLIENCLKYPKFIRLVFKDFYKETTFRFGSFNLIKSNWKVYNKNIYPNLKNNEEGNINIDLDPDIIVHELKDDIDLRLIKDHIFNTFDSNNSYLTTRLKTTNLDAVGIFKEVYFNLFKYKNLKADIIIQNLINKNLNLTKLDKSFLFIRLGSDLSDNYLEYEIPINYPKSNLNHFIKKNIDIKVTDLVKAVVTRDNNFKDRSKIFTYNNNNNIIYIKGDINSYDIKKMMIGLRSKSNTPKDIRLYISNLIFQGINNVKGYAFHSEFDFNLSDLLDIYGNLDYKKGTTTNIQDDFNDINNKVFKYNIASRLNIDKFINHKSNWNIPLVIEQGSEIKNNYINDSPYLYSNKYLTISLDDLKYINNNQFKKIYDLSNFNLSLKYNRNYENFYNKKYEIINEFNYNLKYNYNFNHPYIYPFKMDLGKYNRKYNNLNYNKIVNLQFNILPTNFTFDSYLSRRHIKKRFNDFFTYINDFILTNKYNINFDINEYLKFTIGSIIINNNLKKDNNKLFNNLFYIGEPISYKSIFGINFKIPFDLHNYTNWISVTGDYNSNYDWEVNLFNNIIKDKNILNNNVFNSITKQTHFNLIGDLDFFKLYNTLSFNKSNLDNNLSTKSSNIINLNKNKYDKLKYNFFIKKAVFSYKKDIGGYIPGVIYYPTIFESRFPIINFMYGPGFNIKELILNNQFVTNEITLQPYKILENKDFNYNISMEPISGLNIDFYAVFNKNKILKYFGFNNYNNENNYLNHIDELYTNTISNPLYGYIFKNHNFIYKKYINSFIFLNKLHNTYEDTLKKINSGNLLYTSFLNVFLNNNKNIGLNKNLVKKIYPNWKINYSGLNKYKFINKYFNDFNLIHSYESFFKTIDVNNIYKNNKRDNRYINGDFNSVSFIEAFNPLIGLNLSLKNNFNFLLNYSRERIFLLDKDDFSFNINKFILYNVGMSYKFKDIKFYSNYRGNEKIINGDLLLNADIDYSNLLNLKYFPIDIDNKIGKRILDKKLNLKIGAEYNILNNFIIEFFIRTNLLKNHKFYNVNNKKYQFGFKISYNMNK